MHSIPRRTINIALAASALCFYCGVNAQTQSEYPNRPVTLIVPFPAGGVTDVVARELADGLSKSFGHAFVVENRAGAAGNIGTQAVARSKADGYTLGVLAVSSISIAPYVYRAPGFSVEKDFVPIALLVKTPGVILANSKAPYNSVQELVAYAKRKPGSITYASVGVGSLPHLAAEMFARAAEVRITHVPYKGAGPAMSDLLGGHVDLSFESSLVTAVQNLGSGRIKALGITGRDRVDVLPDIPTLVESGFRGFEVEGWFGLFGPSGLTKAQVLQLNSAANAILSNPGTAQKLAKAGLKVAPGSPEDFAAFLSQDSTAWQKIVREGNIELQ